MFDGHPQGRSAAPRCWGRWVGTGGTWVVPALWGHLSAEAARMPSTRGLKRRLQQREVPPASGKLDQLPLRFTASMNLQIHKDSEGDRQGGADGFKNDSQLMNHPWGWPCHNWCRAQPLGCCWLPEAFHQHCLAAPRG